MKKRIQFLIVFTLLITPLISHAKLVELSDSALKQITGQAGIAIQIDDVVFEEYIGAIKFIDDDGLGANDAPGAAVVLKDRHQVLRINTIIDGMQNNPQTGQDDIQHDYSENFDFPSALTLDVGTCPVLSSMMRDIKVNQAPQIISQSGISDESGWRAAGLDNLLGLSYAEATNTDQTNVVGLVVGLPTVEIATSQNSVTIGIEDMAGTAFNNNRDFVTINQAPSTLAILGGRIEIAPK